MSIFDLRQDYRNKLIFDQMSGFLFGNLVDERGGIRFIQVGANDGKRGDPIQRFVRSGNWTGLLVEPIPAVCAKLRENLGQNDKLTFVNCAIGPEDGEAIFYSCREPHSPLSSFKKESILKHKEWALSKGQPDPETCIEEIIVPVMTLETLCGEYGIDQIDVLVTDTEGFDCKVLRSMDIERRAPKAILFEHTHCDDGETEEALKWLNDHAYEVFFDRFNAMAYKVETPFEFAQIRLFQEILIDASNLKRDELKSLGLANLDQAR